MHTILDCKTSKGLAKITDNGTRGARFCSSESLKRKRVTFLILLLPSRRRRRHDGHGGDGVHVHFAAAADAAKFLKYIKEDFSGSLDQKNQEILAV